jgi:hypothetical protein
MILQAFYELSTDEQGEALQYAKGNTDWLGLELPFTGTSGLKMIRCWQPSTGREAVFDCTTHRQVIQQAATQHTQAA